MFVSYLSNDTYNGDAAGNSHGKCWVVSINDLGGIVWQKTFGGLGYEREFNLTKTSDGNYLASGVTTSKMGTGDIMFRYDTSVIGISPPLSYTTDKPDMCIF